MVATPPTFFLEYAGELHIIALRIEENAKIAIQTHTPHTPLLL